MPTHNPVALSAPLRSPAILALLTLAGLGVLAVGYRFVFGLGGATNLSQTYPWGLWKVVNVAACIAIAGGGFTATALVYIFHQERFHMLARPTLLAAALCYTFAVLGLIIDLGRYYNIWHPILPSMWQPDSVLFEIAMCVMSYLTIMYIEFSPAVCERLAEDYRRPRLAGLCRRAEGLLSKAMFLLILAGVVISCLHQSSLGNLMLVAPSKLHELWCTPVLSLLFLLSAIAGGFPVVIVVAIGSARSLGVRPPIRTLEALGRYVPVLLGVYVGFKLGDLILRGSYVCLRTMSTESLMFGFEMVLGGLVPLALFLSSRVRGSEFGLLVASLLTLGGVVLNRVNVFLVAYRPPFAGEPYVPSLMEWAVTVGLFATMILLYHLLVRLLPVVHFPIAGEARPR